MSGYPQMFQKFGNDFSYEQCPRARIFRRNETLVENVEDMKQLMRYNRFQTDPLSDDNPSHAIASRLDLEQTGPYPFGGIDSKVVNSQMLSQMKCVSICGPTTQDQPAFSWTPQWNDWPHAGQPHTWDFKWMDINMDPSQ